MGQKDISEKLLEEYNDVFADIVNVLLFDGEEIVRPVELEETMIRAQYKADDSRLHELERDVAKNWRQEGVTIALYGIENQTKAEKVMPLRVFGYEGVSYRSQLLNREKRKDKSLHPVVTIVLHFGKSRWNQPKNLKKVISVPAVLDSYVNDFKIHVFEIAWLSDEQIAKFKSDFRVVAEFFTQMRKNNCYQPSEKELKHVDAVLKLLSVFGNVDFFEDFVKVKQKKEGKSMASLFDEIMNQRIKEAAEEKAKELAEEKAKELVEEKAKEQEKNMAAFMIEKINQFQHSFQLSLEEVLKIMKLSMEEYERFKLQAK